ncbi:phage holin family protein [Methylobacterium sp. P31]
MHRRPDGTLALLVAALREGAAHIEALLTLARTEVDGNVRAIVSLVAIVGTIPILLIVTFFLGLDAVVKLLAVPFGSEAPAALIVAAPFLAVALALGWLGARRMALSNLEPWRTWRQVKRDIWEVARTEF